MTLLMKNAVSTSKLEEYSAAYVLTRSSVIPVLVIEQLAHARPLASALIEGGFNVLEITLRTPVALDAIGLLRTNYPDILIGAGTITTVAQLHQCVSAGAQFAISPGISRPLLKTAHTIPFIPGVATVSELMLGINHGFTYFKLFPAQAVGGIGLLKSLASPFPQARFCPTGGINDSNYLDYLRLPNVECVGGSWMVPSEALALGNWQLITQLSKAVLMAVK